MINITTNRHHKYHDYKVLKLIYYYFDMVVFQNHISHLLLIIYADPEYFTVNLNDDVEHVIYGTDKKHLRHVLTRI